MTIAAGSRLGPYEVVGLLGAGGMGEVYRARDPRLGRDVAIKVLPPSVSGDPDRVRRFEQEARATGVLNHPNITAVHDIGTEEGALYVVSELLEGETLRSRLAGGALPVRKAADYGRQIAQGLAAAHEKGIVHRDLKPENLFVTKDGRVKILDFGLAKLTRPEEGGAQTGFPTATAGTEPGVVLGTLGYMSPEQVRGKPADHRSDLFSFGAILYEMLAGKRAFSGDSAADTMSAILREDPPELSATNQSVPPGLERIVRHCLEKSPEERFHSAHDLAFDLGAVSETSAPALVAPRRSRRGISNAVLAAVALLLAAAIVYLMIRSGRAGTAEPPRTSFLTFSGYDKDPAASPDGKLVAFVSQRDGRSRIWLKQIATGDEVALTSGEDLAPRFSPDGSEVLFARAEGAVSSLFRVSLVGGEPRKMIDNALAADWSPDGSRIAFVRSSEKGQRIGSVLVVAGTDGSAERSIGETNDLPLIYPRWAPNGRTIAAVRLGGITSVADQIGLFDVETGKSRLIPVPAGGGTVSSVAWTRSGEEIVYAQAAQLTSLVPLSRLVVQSVGTGENRTVLWLPNLVWGVDLLPSGDVVFDAITFRENLREIPLSSSGGGPSEEWFTRGSSVDRQPVYSPDGERIAFASTRSGNIDIWQVHRSTRAIRRLTSDPADDWDPGFTPDGKNLLFSSNRGGRFEIWIADADGRRARQLTHDGVDAENPNATADGEWIVYGSGHPQKRGIWKIRKDGSRATRLVEGTFVHPEISPDGRYVLYHSPPDPGWTEIRVLRLDDGASVDFRIRAEFPGGQAPASLMGTPASLGRARWMPDGRAIAYVAVDERRRTGVMVQDFVPGRDTRTSRRPLVGFDGERNAESFGIAPDGARLMLSGIEMSPGLMLAKGLPGLKSRETRERTKR